MSSIFRHCGVPPTGRPWPGTSSSAARLSGICTRKREREKKERTQVSRVADVYLWESVTALISCCFDCLAFGPSVPLTKSATVL